MAPNKIFKSAFIKNVIKNGKPLAVEYATETTSWRRTLLAQSVQEDFSQAVEKSDVPAGAAHAILA
jgi:hypothetical protein